MIRVPESTSNSLIMSASAAFRGACAQQRSILPMTHVSWVKAMGKEAT